MLIITKGVEQVSRLIPCLKDPVALPEAHQIHH